MIEILINKSGKGLKGRGVGFDNPMREHRARVDFST